MNIVNVSKQENIFFYWMLYMSTLYISSSIYLISFYFVYEIILILVSSGAEILNNIKASQDQDMKERLPSQHRRNEAGSHHSFHLSLHLPRSNRGQNATEPWMSERMDLEQIRGKMCGLVQ